MAESFEDRVIGRILVAYKEADPDGRFEIHKLHNFDDLSMNSIDYHMTQLAKATGTIPTMVKTRMLCELSQQERSQLLPKRPASAARNRQKPAKRSRQWRPTI